MPTPFTLLLRGTQTYFNASTATGNVPTGVADAAPNTIIAPVNGSGGWFAVNVYGMDADLKNEAEAFLSASGSEYLGSNPRWTFAPKTLRYNFPADWAAWLQLQRAVAKGNGYISMTVYDVALHPVNEVIPVTMTCEKIHEYPKGKKSMTISFRKRPLTDALA